MKKLLIIFACLFGTWLQVDAFFKNDKGDEVYVALENGKSALARNDGFGLSSALRSLSTLFQSDQVSSAALEPTFNFIEDVMHSPFFYRESKYLSIVLTTIFKRIKTNSSGDISISPELLAWVKTNTNKYFCDDAGRCLTDLFSDPVLYVPSETFSEDEQKGSVWMAAFSFSKLVNNQTRLDWLDVLIKVSAADRSVTQGVLHNAIADIVYSMTLNSIPRSTGSPFSSEYILKALKILLPYLAQDSTNRDFRMSRFRVLLLLREYCNPVLFNFTYDDVLMYQKELFDLSGIIIDDACRSNEVDFSMLRYAAGILCSMNLRGVDEASLVRSADKFKQYREKIIRAFDYFLNNNIHEYLSECVTGDISFFKSEIENAFYAFVSLSRLDFVAPKSSSSYLLLYMIRVVGHTFNASPEVVATIHHTMDPMVLNMMHMCLEYELLQDIPPTFLFIKRIVEEIVKRVGPDRNKDNTIRIMSYLNRFFFYDVSLFKDRSKRGLIVVPDKRAFFDKIELECLTILNDLLRENRLVYDQSVYNDIRLILGRSSSAVRDDKIKAAADTLRQLLVHYKSLEQTPAGSVADRSRSPQRLSDGAASARV